MKVEIFDVEHGQCTLITSDSGSHMLVDAGHNTTTGWRPSTMLEQRGITTIDRLIVTNFDEDHVSDLQNVARVANITSLTRNRSVTGNILLNLKGSVRPGGGMERLSGMLDTYVHPLTYEPDFGPVKYHTFWNTYPTFTDENNLSILYILEWPWFAMAFTGDLEVAGWDKILENVAAQEALKKVDLFMASHHGRLNGYNSKIFDWATPRGIIISDSGIDYESQRTGPLYRSQAAGCIVNGETRTVLTTRRDGKITIDVTPQGFSIATARRGPRLF